MKKWKFCKKTKQKIAKIIKKDSAVKIFLLKTQNKIYYGAEYSTSSLEQLIFAAIKLMVFTKFLQFAKFLHFAKIFSHFHDKKIS